MGNFRVGLRSSSKWDRLGYLNRCGLAVVGRLGLGITRSRLALLELGLSKMEGMRMDRERRKAKDKDRKERKKRKILLIVAWRGQGWRFDWRMCLGCLQVESFFSSLSSGV